MILPNINIPTSPFICAYIKFDWEQVKTFEQATNFVHKWLDEYEVTQNGTKKQAIKQWVFPIYSILTNKSYESKLNF